MTDKSQQAKLSKRAQLLDIVDKELLIKILNAFTKATDLTANIVDIQGRSIFSREDAQKSCRFCRIIWEKEREKGLKRCKGAYERAGKQAAIFGEPYIFRCPAGLIEWAAPIIINGQHLGTIICGQVLMWEPEEFFWIELRQMNKELTVDFYELIDAAKELKVLTVEKVQGAADLLYVTANNIMKYGYENQKQKQEMALQQSLLNEEIQNRKSLEEKLSIQSISLNYSLEKERDLVSKIKLGDFEGAKNIYQTLLADIFLKGAAKINKIKARVLELGVILSRASVDGGADLNEALDISSTFLKDVGCYETKEEIDLAAIKTFDLFLQAIKNNSNASNRLAIRGIKDYILENYQENLSLEEICDAVFLSPNYASKIFKDDQGMTIMEYVTKVKLEEAKRLLRIPGISVEDIAEKLGYSDPSYFTKVFRRKIGITPTQYRKQS
ncbi:AraC family transcriptional regulator [Alkalibaculum bacchi]|uniref:AraC family transcriptional regulator n=1 Tax=Alkalibaculum bacchi TaxID=645887 RepID=A0A366I9V1_9FIRM|nr:PocR ligand-binding domain-containing protein [Alkalibaculum bacchi]RBP66656.1 AraC family transcriptional regulator [Alkalibaculum bacchi]